MGAALLLFTTILLMGAALYNHFPLLNGDTGAYIHNAYTTIIPKDRPLFYSWFIQFISRERSLWYVVLFQCGLTAGLIRSFMSRFYGGVSFAAKTTIILLLCLGTGICWFTGMLMPDFITPLLFFAAILFLYERAAPAKFIWALLFLFFSLCHNSHLMEGLLFLICLFPLLRRAQQRKCMVLNAVVLVGINLLSWAILCTMNLRAGYGFTPSATSHVFVMGRMAENGVLKAYLDDHCPSPDLKLCPFKDQLPEHAWDFIWNDKGAFAHSGYWDSSKKEYTRIIHATLTRPKYLALHAREAAKGTLLQTAQFSVGDALPANLENSNVLYKIEEHYPKKLQYLRESKQYHSALHYETLNTLYLLFPIAVLLAFAIVAFRKPLAREQAFLLKAALLFILINAFISCTFANILPRLNVRTIWILPLLLMLVIADKLSSRKRNTV